MVYAMGKIFYTFPFLCVLRSTYFSAHLSSKAESVPGTILLPHKDKTNIIACHYVQGQNY